MFSLEHLQMSLMNKAGGLLEMELCQTVCPEMEGRSPEAMMVLMSHTLKEPHLGMSCSYPSLWDCQKSQCSQNPLSNIVRKNHSWKQVPKSGPGPLMPVTSFLTGAPLCLFLALTQLQPEGLWGGEDRSTPHLRTPPQSFLYLCPLLTSLIAGLVSSWNIRHIPAFLSPFPQPQKCSSLYCSCACLLLIGKLGFISSQEAFLDCPAGKGLLQPVPLLWPPWAVAVFHWEPDGLPAWTE